MITYTDLEAALARATERSGAAATDAEYLTELLELSAGSIATVRHYRPFYVAAKWMEQDSANQSLSEAKGVKFTNLATPIASLLQLQASYDSAHGLTVPAGFEAIEVEEQAVAVVRRRNFSHSPRILP